MAKVLDDCGGEPRHGAGAADHGDAPGARLRIERGDPCHEIPSVSEIDDMDTRIDARLRDAIVARLKGPAGMDDDRGIDPREMRREIRLSIEGRRLGKAIRQGRRK